MKLLTVIGARPQFIKASSLSRVIANHPDINEVIVHTGQHFDSNMSDIFFSEMGIPKPGYHLGVSGGGHGEMTGRQLEQVEKVLLKERPDVVLVYGDTNSTLAGALAASKLHIPIAHVEAGLRSYNRRMPEEINRVLTDHISHWLFTPTERASANLTKEGISDEKIHLVGDIMYDTALYYGAQVALQQNKHVNFQEPYILATIHRAENTDSENKLRIIIGALLSLADQYRVILPLHPRTRKILENNDTLRTACARLCIIDPVGYLEMVALEKNARLILTDSGGVQKEAYFYNVPCVTIREETEWTELIESGWNRLAAPVSVAHVLGKVGEALEAEFGKKMNLYGDGDAAHKICNVLKAH